MEYPPNISAILQSIKDYKGFRTNTELAEYLGITKSAISNWIARGYIDESRVLSRIPEINVRFLRTGIYPMTEQEDVVDVLLKRVEWLERRIERLEKQKRED
jgi:hypothetical protein